MGSIEEAHFSAYSLSATISLRNPWGHNSFSLQVSQVLGETVQALAPALLHPIERCLERGSDTGQATVSQDQRP